MKQRVKQLEQESVKRKLAKTAVAVSRENEERYHKLIVEMFNGFALHEIICNEAGTPFDYRFLKVNKAFEDMTGLKVKDIIGKTVLEIQPEIEQHWIDTYGKTALSGKPMAFDAHSAATDKYFDVLAYSPKIDQFATIFTDITKRKDAEEKLRKSKRRYRSIMISMNDEAFIYSSDFRIQYINPAAVRRIGRDATQERCYNAVFGLDEPCSWCIFDEVLKGKKGSYELLNPTNNRYYSISSSPISYTDGAISTLSVCRDITDVKKMERRLRQAHKMEAIGTLAGGIAHQFNNALYGITGTIDLLEMDFPNDKKVADYIGKMRISARRMTHLAAQLLAYARGGKYQAETISLRDFLKETLPLIQHAAGSDIRVNTDLPRDLFKVKTDLSQMQMVLSAVLTNASESMEGKGSIRVACKNTMITNKTMGDFPRLKTGRYVCLAVSDNGKGMDEETRKRIFEPFFTTGFEGRGLGMAAAYGIVKNHAGWISVDSELGHGTTVKIYLPAIERVQARLTDAKTPIKKNDQPKPEWIKGTGTILVIEDEKQVMEVSHLILERLVYHVLETRSGQEAVEVVNTFEGRIDLAMLDILMPDMSGNAVYPLLKKARPDLKVLVFSGYSIDGPARDLLDAGAEDFIQKPFMIAELSEKLKKMIGS